MDLFIGIDLGTTAVKVLVVNEKGVQVSLGAAECPVYEPGPGMQEQDAGDVWNAMIEASDRALSAIDRGRVRAMSFSSAMHGFMAVDEEGWPLTRMMTWADGRATHQAGRIEAGRGHESYLRTGCPVTALYYPARLRWLSESEPEVFRRAAGFCSIKDVVVQRLTGRLVMDRSHASSNGLLDLASLDWDRGALAAGGVGPERLPELVDSDAPIGGLTHEAAGLLGLRQGLPVAPGAGDGGLANLGSGSVVPGQVTATIGTSGAVRKIIEEPWFHPEGVSWCYYLAEDSWYTGGAMNSGGIVMRWLRDGLLSDVRDAALSEGREPYEKIMELAARVPPGAEGLTFLPYIYGERTPYWNPDARGVLFGLSPGHGKAHLAKAALEGICMCMAHLFEVIEPSPGGMGEVRVTGGFTRSDEWMGILADVLGRPLSVPAARESSAMGAAILAMKAAGHIQSVSSASGMSPVERRIEPDVKNSGAYRERLEFFKELYNRVEPDFVKARDEG